MRFSAPILAFLIIPGYLHAYFGKNNDGQAVFAWAELLQSPRSIALEGAASALTSEDFGAAILNPALLFGDGYKAGAAWQSGDLADRKGVAALSHDFFHGRVQHSYGVVDNGQVWNRDEDGEKTGVASYPLAQYYAITASIPLEHFKFGFTGRFLWERLSETEGAQAGMGLAFDWGFLWNNVSNRYGFALIGRYLGVQTRSFIRGGVNGYPMAQELAAATFWRQNSKLTWLFECNAPRFSPAVGKLAAEYRFSKPLFFRFGMQRSLIDVGNFVKSIFDSDEDMPKSSYYRLFSAGAGYKIRMFTVDYSYGMLMYGMGSEHHLSLSADF